MPTFIDGGLALSAPEPRRSRTRARAARATMHALTTSPDVFEEFFVSARIGLALADLTGRFVRVNDTYADMVGRAPEDLVGVALGEVLSGTGPEQIGRLLAGDVPAVQSEQSYLQADETLAWVLHGVATVSGPEGRPTWLAVSAQDITERRRVEQELRELTAVLTEQAVRDPLTALANRALFEERLRGALSRDARSGDGTGVLFLDLDGFKAVNDRHGHAVGDAVLRATAERLAGAVRPADTVARLGGDEFVILVEVATEAGLQALVGRLERAVTGPIALPGGLTLDVGVSIGYALSTGGADDPSGLLARADAQMYAAKRRIR